jgi:hypothetical protein
MANYPDRCQHLKINGTQCGSPALRRNRFCFFHKRFQDERIRLSADRRRGVATFVLPVLEDANSIQIALMQVMRLLLSQQIDHKTASLLLYALQTASTNLRLTNFKPLTNDVILDVRDVANTPLNEHIWEDEDYEDEEDQLETPAELAAAKAAARDEAKALQRKRSEDSLREWAARHPDVELVREDGYLRTKRKLPAPDLKKPVSNSTTDEIRAELSKMVQNQFLPAFSEKFAPGTQPDRKEEKKVR